MLKEIISSNVYVYDLAVSLRHSYRNRVVKEIIRETEEIDSLKDYEQFAKVIKKFKERVDKNFVFMQSGYAADSYLYGHLETLYKYAGREKEVNYNAFPKVEHGTFASTNGMKKELINNYGNLLMMGNYKSYNIHSINPLKPVFTVGPYIYYADSIYSKEKIEKLKKKFGRTLLIFPMHSYESGSVSHNDKIFVNNIINNVAKGYDTILVSVYWNDVNQKIYDLLKAEGAILVSNGFRGDKGFIRRLKTLFMLADDVCGNSFGTHVGYSISEGKRFFYFNSEFDLEIKKGELVQGEKKEINMMHQWVKDTFQHNDTGQLSSAEITKYESWWGGEKAIKTPEEMNNILLLGEEIYRRSHGFTNKFDNIIKEMLIYNDLPRQQIDLLNKSLGNEIF